MKEQIKEWLLTLLVHTRNSAPVSITVVLEAMGKHIDVVYKGVLIIYTVLMAAHLLWKWGRSVKDGTKD